MGKNWTLNFGLGQISVYLSALVQNPRQNSVRASGKFLQMRELTELCRCDGQISVGRLLVGGLGHDLPGLADAAGNGKGKVSGKFCKTAQPEAEHILLNQ